MKNWKKIIKDLKKHEKTWKAFFMTLGEDVWNVPFKARKMDIEKEWEITSGILKEVKLELSSKEIQVELE